MGFLMLTVRTFFFMFLVHFVSQPIIHAKTCRAGFMRMKPEGKTEFRANYVHGCKISEYFTKNPQNVHQRMIFAQLL
jgi:hypothetical protein